MATHRLIVLGAAGRDFHDFNVYWRDRDDIEVVCFTATQIPGIDGRRYPPELAGPRYPDGIRIEEESNLEAMIEEFDVDMVSMAYSDLPHETVMHLAARVNAAGASFVMLGAAQTMIKSTRPVIAVCAVRTGCGKSQITRHIGDMLRADGLRVAVVRHPMPYGDLVAQACQRFATLEDLDTHKCTIEEREEYEPHIVAGNLLFAGVDYERILREAEKDADVILWDGGNNDTSFFKPDLTIVVVDPHREGDETTYYPGETNLRLADIIVVNKVCTADPFDVTAVEENCRAVNPGATTIKARSPVELDDPDAVRGKRVLVVEDGPTLTHGGMRYGAGHVATKAAGGHIIDPRPFAKGSLKETFAKFPHLESVLPAMGYGDAQMKDLADTITASDCDVIVVGTPIDLRRTISFDRPAVRARYSIDADDARPIDVAVRELTATQKMT